MVRYTFVFGNFGNVILIGQINVAFNTISNIAFVTGNLVSIKITVFEQISFARIIP